MQYNTSTANPFRVGEGISLKLRLSNNLTLLKQDKILFEILCMHSKLTLKDFVMITEKCLQFNWERVHLVIALILL